MYNDYAISFFFLNNVLSLSPTTCIWYDAATQELCKIYINEKLAVYDIFGCLPTAQDSNKRMTILAFTKFARLRKDASVYNVFITKNLEAKTIFDGYRRLSRYEVNLRNEF